MAAYVSVHATINDPEKQQAYGAAAGPLVEKHGGIPKDYKGAYELHLESQGKSLAAALQDAKIESDAVIASFQ